MGRNGEIEVRFIDSDEWDEAIGLTYKTFLEFDAPMFTEEGINQFREFISDQSLKRMFDRGEFQIVGAYDGDSIVGVIALRDNRHISLLFVDRNYQGRGVGTCLVNTISDYAVNKLHQDIITVNSSPYAVSFYHKLGFEDLCEERLRDGIRYTPMKLDLRDKEE